MIVKSALFTLIGIALGFNCGGQTLKIYSGTFQLSYPFFQNGTATYTYYDDPESYKPIRQGKFKYSFSGVGLYSGHEEEIYGNYEKDLKDGSWKYFVTQTDFDAGDYFQSASISLESHYDDGLPDGEWKFNFSAKVRQKKYVNLYTGEYSWGPWLKPVTTEMTATFKQGILVGNMRNESVEGDLKKTIDCNFNDLGNFDGITTLTSGPNESITEFKNGFLIKEVTRNLQNGQVQTIDNSHELPMVEEIILQTNGRPEELESDQYQLTVCRFSQMAEITKAVKYFFDDVFFHYEDIYGDLVKETDGLNLYDFKIIPPKELDLFRQAYDEYSSLYTVIYESQYTDSEARNLLFDVNSVVQEYRRINEALQSSFNQNWSNYSDLLSKYEILEGIESNLAVKVLLEKIRFEIVELNEIREESQARKFVQARKEAAMRLEAEKKQKLLRELSLLDREIEAKRNEIKSKFWRSVNYISEDTHDYYSIAKKRIWDVYVEMDEQYTMNETQDTELAIDAARNHRNHLNRVVHLRYADTKSLEKQLKQATDLSQKQTILGLN